MEHVHAKLAILDQDLFDPAFYLNLALSQRAPRLFEFARLLDHYIEIGWKLGLDPSPGFSVKLYLKANPDVTAAAVEPLCHYALQGRSEGRPLGYTARDLVPKGIAFYLPQFHPDPHNEAWWGKGFTEWTNVTRAKPFFAEHAQPILPGELGFYDLRVAETRQDQATLAREYGIHAFCYYYYWFNGRTVLERPLAEILRSGEPDFPFCLCWANENWTRTWDGMEQELLLQQRHTAASDYSFIYDVLPTLQDERYLRIDGRPLLLVYRADLLAEPSRTADLWREVAVQAGLNGLYLAAVDFRVRDPRPYGFDCLVQFPPHHFPSGDLTPDERQRLGAPDTMKLKSYPLGVARLLAESPHDRFFECFPAVMPGWDNTARRMEQATVFHGSTPTLFRLWTTAEMLRAVRNLPEHRRFVFVNAWNEWAEGAVLEPRRDLGRAYLEAFGRARSAVEAYLVDGEEDPFVELVRWLEAVDECIRAGRTPVFAVGHDAQRAGAQILLMQLLDGMQAQENPVMVFTILHGDGPLASHYGPPERVLRANRFAGQGLVADDVADLLMAMLSTRARKPVLCNTAVMAHYARAAAKWGLKSLLYVHELPTSIDMYVGRESFRAAAAHATRIVTVSRYAQAALAEAFPELARRIEVIYASTPAVCPAPISASRQLFASLGINPWETVVLGCGAIHPRKGVDFLPAIVEETRRRLGRPVRFVWCGGPQNDDDFLRWIEYDLAARGLTDLVRFTGHRSDAVNFYPAARAFILPSREDPFPLVALEAAGAGLPVVLFSGAGGAEELLDGLDEAKAPYGDVAGFVDRLVRLLRHEHARDYVGATLRKRIEGPFSWNNYISAFSTAWLGTEPKPQTPAAAARVADAPVSVVIPFYNHGAFIEETLASVARQTRAADEIIIVDDGSRSADRERCEVAAAAYPNARFVSRPNQGAHAAINDCLAMATGEFVTILNSDDLYHPCRLEQLVQAAELRPAVGMFATECEFIDGEGRRFDQGEWYRGGWDLIDAGTAPWLALLHRNFLMTTSNFFFRTAFLRKVGPFRAFRYAHDLDMLQRVLMQGEIGLLRSQLIRYRFHGQNTIRENLKDIRVEVAQIVAEAFIGQVRLHGFSLAAAAEIATIVRQQALGGAFEVFLSAVAGQKSSSAEYPMCDPPVRALAHAAQTKLDQQTLKMWRNAEKSATAITPLMLERNGNLLERIATLSAHSELASKTRNSQLPPAGPLNRI